MNKMTRHYFESDLNLAIKEMNESGWRLITVVKHYTKDINGGPNPFLLFWEKIK